MKKKAKKKFREAVKQVQEMNKLKALKLSVEDKLKLAVQNA